MFTVASGGDLQSWKRVWRKSPKPAPVSIERVDCRKCDVAARTAISVPNEMTSERLQSLQVQRLKGFVRHFSRQPRHTIAIARLDLTQGAGGDGGRRCGCCVAAAQELTFATRCTRYLPSLCKMVKAATHSAGCLRCHWMCSRAAQTGSVSGRTGGLLIEQQLVLHQRGSEARPIQPARRQKQPKAPQGSHRLCLQRLLQGMWLLRTLMWSAGM